MTLTKIANPYRHRRFARLALVLLALAALSPSPARAVARTQHHARHDPAAPDRHSRLCRRRVGRSRRSRVKFPAWWRTTSDHRACSFRSTRRPSSRRVSAPIVCRASRIGAWSTRKPSSSAASARATASSGPSSVCGTCSRARSSRASSSSRRPKDARRIGHIIADAIYERITGEKGYFDTRIVFVDESGPKNKRMKRLAIMDQDGFNVRLLTAGQNLVLTPRFSPSTQEITYTSFEGETPKVYLLNIETGQKEIVGAFPGMTFRAALLARRPAHHHEPGAGRQFQSVRHGSAQPAHEPAHQ